MVAHTSDGTAKNSSAAPSVTSVSGQTGVVTLSKSDVGLSNVDNTSDANKPVSVAMQNSLNQKANTSSLSAVATTGFYNDLINKPIVPDGASLVYLSGAQQINGEKDFLGGLKVAGAAVVTADDSRLSDARTPSDNSVSTTKLQDNAITEPKLAAANTPTTGNFLAWDGTSLKWQDQAAGAVESVSGRTGAVTLTKSDVGLSNVDNISDANKPISTAVQAALDDKVATNDGRLSDTRTPSDNSVTATKLQDDAVTDAKLQDNAVTEPKLAAANAPTTGNFLAWDGTSLKWQDQAAGAVESVSGRTGAVTLTKADVGLSSVDNTSDADKPVSSATQASLALKADLSSPAFTGTPTAPTASVGTNTTQVATTAFVLANAGGASGISRSVITVTSITTIGDADNTDYVVFIGASGEVILPTAVNNTNRYSLKNIDSSNKTVSTTSSQTIDGSLTLILTPGASVDVVSDNTNWRIL